MPTSQIEDDVLQVEDSAHEPGLEPDPPQVDLLEHVAHRRIEARRELVNVAEDHHQRGRDEQRDQLILGQRAREDTDGQCRRAEEEQAEVADEDLRARDLAVHLDEERHVQREHQEQRVERQGGEELADDDLGVAHR
jgi:hypothetical protein